MATSAQSPTWNNANHNLIQKVDFIDVLAQYSYNEDLVCKIKFDSYVPQEGDRVGIFRVGWELVKEYIVFEWIPFGVKAKEVCIEFNKHILPKNEDLYQFCYITGDNELYGASEPFSFNTINTPRGDSTNSQPIVDHKRNTSCCSTDSGYLDTNELLKLREENHILRECLKALLSERNRRSENCDKHVELCEEMNRLKSACIPVVQVEHELALLRQQFSDIEKGYKNLCQKMEKMLVQDRAKDFKNDERMARSINVTSTPKPSEFCIDNLGTIPPFPFPK